MPPSVDNVVARHHGMGFNCPGPGTVARLTKLQQVPGQRASSDSTC